MPPKPGAADEAADEALEREDDTAGDLGAGAEDAGEGGQDDPAGLENDADGADGDETGQGEVADAPRGPRENASIRQLREDRQRLQEERDRLAQERDDALRRAAVIPGETAAERIARDRAEQERVALMSAEDRADYYRQKDRLEFSQSLQQIRFENAQATDRAAFQALAARNTFAQKNADRVERLVADEARQGRFISREVALKYIVGESVMKRAEAAAPKQRARAAERVDRERAKGGDARSTVPANRNRSPQDERAARRERLRNVQL